MPQPPRPLLIAAVSFLLAVAADLLLRGTAWGINFGLLASGVGVTCVWLQRRTHVRLSKVGQAFCLLSVVFALLFSFRDSDALKVANSVALVFCLGATLLSCTGNALRTSAFSKLLTGTLRQWLDLPLHAFALATRARNERTPSPESKQRANAVARGLALASPLLLVFGTLFGSADPIFRTKIEALLQPNLNTEALGTHLATLLLSLTFIAGLLHALILRDDRPEVPVAELPAQGRIGTTEMGIVLGSLNLLFASFIAVQFRYLFGAGKTVSVTPGLSYAEYARGGFFELVWVAALAFAVLLGADALLKREERASENFFRWLGRGLVLMVFGVIGSALLRMKLYTDAFGLTELRVYSTVFMVWLTIAFAWMLATLLKGRPKKFAFGSLLSGLGVIVCTNLMDPEGLIVRTNLAKPNADFAYLTSLSDDALLAVAKSEPTLLSKHREQYAKWLKDRKYVAAADWRELNLSRLALLR